MKKARSDGKVEIVTRKEIGQPTNRRRVFRNIERIGDDNSHILEEDEDDVDDFEQKIKYVCGLAIVS